MKQISLGESEFECKSKRTHKREFLEEMNRTVPWGELVTLIDPARAHAWRQRRAPALCDGDHVAHPLLQQWFNLSDPAMEEALYNTPMFREFAALDMG